MILCENLHAGGGSCFGRLRASWACPAASLKWGDSPTNLYFHMWVQILTEACWWNPQNVDTTIHINLDVFTTNYLCNLSGGRCVATNLPIFTMSSTTATKTFCAAFELGRHEWFALRCLIINSRSFAFSETDGRNTNWTMKRLLHGTLRLRSS